MDKPDPLRVQSGMDCAAGALQTRSAVDWKDLLFTVYSLDLCDQSVGSGLIKSGAGVGFIVEYLP